ncbi:hypothetical protein B0H11DRAFT_1933945 [Mycena galericulata]|nr:hypothetical protein B0H11DRAFT_1933945 [Mycena galericulata]
MPPPAYVRPHTRTPRPTPISSPRLPRARAAGIVREPNGDGESHQDEMLTHHPDVQRIVTQSLMELDGDAEVEDDGEGDNLDVEAEADEMEMEVREVGAQHSGVHVTDEEADGEPDRVGVGNPEADLLEAVDATKNATTNGAAKMLR